MNEAPFPIHVVDDDRAVVKALARLLRPAGYSVQTYHSADDFIAKREIGRVRF